MALHIEKKRFVYGCTRCPSLSCIVRRNNVSTIEVRVHADHMLKASMGGMGMRARGQERQMIVCRGTACHAVMGGI